VEAVENATFAVPNADSFVDAVFSRLLRGTVHGANRQAPA